MLPLDGKICQVNWEVADADREITDTIFTINPLRHLSWYCMYGKNRLTISFSELYSWKGFSDYCLLQPPNFRQKKYEAQRGYAIWLISQKQRRNRNYFWFTSGLFVPHYTILSSKKTFRIQQNLVLFSIFLPTTFTMKQLSGKEPTATRKDFWSVSQGPLPEATSCSTGTCSLPENPLPKPHPTMNFHDLNYLPCHMTLPSYRTNLPQRVPELDQQCLYLPQHFMLLELTSQTVANLNLGIFFFPFCISYNFAFLNCGFSPESVLQDRMLKVQYIFPTSKNYKFILHTSY